MKTNFISLLECNQSENCIVAGYCYHRTPHEHCTACYLHKCEIQDGISIRCRCIRNKYQLIKIKEQRA
jgi:hypothetical protein